MADLKTIEDLTNAFGPSGFEEEVVKAVQKHCEGLNLRNDAMYNVYATMPDAKGNRPVFMLDAHTDECGFMVQNVEDNGLLSIITLGGFHMTRSLYFFRFCIIIVLSYNAEITQKRGSHDYKRTSLCQNRSGRKKYFPGCQKAFYRAAFLKPVHPAH